MDEIIIVNGTQLANKELGKKVDIILKANRQVMASQWDLTFALTDILFDELWTDDFETQKDFATFVGLSSGSISQYKGARRFLDLSGADKTKYSVANSYLLSTLIVEKECADGSFYDTSKLVEFQKWAVENGLDLEHISQKALRTAISNFLNPIEEVEETKTSAEDVEEAETSAEEVAEITPFEMVVNTLPSLSAEELEKLASIIMEMNK